MRRVVAFAAFQTGAQANGGLESFTQLLASVEVERVVITQLEGPFTERWRDLGCRVHVIDVPPPKLLRGAAHLAYTAMRAPALTETNRKMARLMRDLAVSVVHCNDPAAFWYAGLAARGLGLPVLVNVRGTKEASGTYGIKWRILRQLVQEIVVLSAEMARELERRAPPLTRRLSHARIGHVYTGLDFSRLAPGGPEARSAARQSLGIAEDARAIGHIGVFNENKNQLDLIERVLPEVLASEPKARMYFVGDFEPASNGYAAKCRDSVARLGLDERVRFVGFTGNMEDWYRALDVVCVTSRHEGLPRAMIEGLAYGVPIISTDVVSAREVLEAHGCGCVVAQGDYAGLATAIRRLVRDEHARQLMADNGKRAARALFDSDACGRAYMEKYERLANTSRSRG